MMSPMRSESLGGLDWEPVREERTDPRFARLRDAAVVSTQWSFDLIQKVYEDYQRRSRYQKMFLLLRNALICTYYATLAVGIWQASEAHATHNTNHYGYTLSAGALAYLIYRLYSYSVRGAKSYEGKHRPPLELTAS